MVFNIIVLQSMDAFDKQIILTLPVMILVSNIYTRVHVSLYILTAGYSDQIFLKSKGKWRGIKNFALVNLDLR